MVGAMRRYGGDAVDDNTIMRMLIPVGAPLEFGANPPPEGDRLGNNWSFCSADPFHTIQHRINELSRRVQPKRLLLFRICECNGAAI
mmetsp:Transcript_3458/g.2835  ORF Transcript_3458/g.2835 Transcript_3458/m.2835 type:complete len:87 (+) Transcript_3458:655-915(+)